MGWYQRRVHGGSLSEVMEATAMLLLLMMIPAPLLVEGTSFKMDFLSSGTVRTDPLMFSQTGECLSDHVHRFYGAASDRTMRPEVSYSDLRNAPGNTGNVEENKSLYWNPAIYKVVNQNGNKESDRRRVVCLRLLPLAHRAGHGLPQRVEDEGERQRGGRTGESGL